MEHHIFSATLVYAIQQTLFLQQSIRTFRFYKVPKITIQIFKHCNGSVKFLDGLSYKMNIVCKHSVVIFPEIVCMQEKKNPTTCLIPYPAFLLFIRSFCKQQCATIFSLWRNDDPTFCFTQYSIFNQIEF